MMKKRYRTLIALLFLVAFVSAIGKNISCDLGHLPFFNHAREHDHGHTHSTGQHHHHTHNHDHSQPAHGHDDHKHGSGQGEDDGCCKNLAKTLFSGLTKPVNTKFQFHHDYTPVTAVYYESLPEVTVNYKAADYYSWKAPPPKIPDIRVLLHSFII